MKGFKEKIEAVSEELAPRLDATESENDVLRGIIRQSSFFYEIQKSNLSPYPTHGDTIAIAAISMNQKCRFDQDDCWLKTHTRRRRTLVGQGVVDIADYENSYVDMLNVAIEEGANIVCFSEFAHPPRVAGESESPPDKQLEFESRLSGVVQDNQLLLIGGSHHCDETHYNLCRVFSSDAENEEAIRIPHAKRRRAIRLKETIKTPNNPFIRNYGTKYGNIAILICFDALDPAAAFAIASHNSQLQEHERIRFVFVPTFSLNIEIEKACKRLSYIANVVVCYVNWSALIGSSWAALFVSGDRFEELDDCELGVECIQTKEIERADGICRIWTIGLDLLRETFVRTEQNYSEPFRAIRAPGRQHDPMKFRY